MQLVTYPIHYGRGKDGRFDLERIAARGSDHQPVWVEMDLD